MKLYTFFCTFFISLFFTLTAAAQVVDTLPVEDGGWNGGDAAYNRLYDNGARLWVFGDSLIGPLEHGKRPTYEMFRNAVAVEKGKFIRYYWGEEEQGVFVNWREGEWYWPSDFIILEGRGLFFMRRMAATDEEDALGFKVVGVDLIEVKNLQAAPDLWDKKVVPFPNDDLTTGIALAVNDGYIYFLASDEGPHHALHLGRIKQQSQPINMVMEYYNPTSKAWAKTPSEPFFAKGSPEASLHYDAARQQWRFVYTPTGLSRDIVLRIATELTGEWSEEEHLYSCPEPERNKNYICYAGKEVFDTDGKLRVTYSVNSLDFDDLEKDADIYVPRIISFPDRN